MRTFFHCAAISNWMLGFVVFFHKFQFLAFGLEPPTYPTLMVLTGALTIVFGVLYWDIAEHAESRLALLKIGVLAKAAASFIWIIGLVTGDLPDIFWLYATWADFFWLPAFIYYYVRLSIHNHKPVDRSEGDILNPD